MTVHVEEVFEPIDDGVQLTDTNVGTSVWSVMVAVGLWLPRVAVTVADGVVVLVNVPVVAENVALLCPDSTVTLEGTLRAVLLLCTDTVVLTVAAALRETVQVEDVFEPIVEGVQPTDVSVDPVTGVWRVMAVIAFWPPNVAVMVAPGVVDAVKDPVVAEKVLLVFPECMITPAGTVRAGLLLVRITAVELVGT